MFKEYGLPQAIRTDNGAPFASANAMFGLSRLAVWWLRLGIHLERIKPGHPQQNGRHERMHLTLKKEATKPASFNFLQQQDRFDRFIGVTTTSAHTRHSAAAIRRAVYAFSACLPCSRSAGVPVHDRTVLVTQCGRICIGSRKINLSTVFAGQFVGIREVADKIWLVSFLDFDLGFFDEAAARVEPGANPFASKVLTMSPG